jgi:hypothetical protein
MGEGSYVVTGAARGVGRGVLGRDPEAHVPDV